MWQQNQAELQSLKKIVEQHQGFYQGVRAVLNQQANLKGIIGVVAELITVPEKLQIAIQSAANTQLQSIVTATQTAARDAINFLHQQRAGRATFLPQNIIKSRKIINNQLGDLLTKDYFIGIASDLITYPVSLSNVMENLFGALLVVTDIDAAIKASNLTQHRFRIVTLKGDIISPGGAMTGGQNKNNVDLLSQRSRITKLQTWLKTAQVQLKEQQNLINKSQEQIQALIDTQKHQQQQAQNLENKARDLQNLVQLKKQQEENDQQQLQAHDFQLQQLKQQLDLLQTQTAANEQSQQGVTVKIEQQQQLVTQQQALLTDFDAQKQVYEARLHTYKTQLALAENNLQNHQHLQQVNQKELQQVQQQYQNIQEQLQELNQNTSGRNSNQDYQSQIQDLKKQLNQLQTQIHDTKQQRQQIIQAAQTLQQQSTRLFELQKNWTNQQEDIAINLTNLTNQIRQKLSILEQQYQLSFEAAFQKIPSDWQLTPAKKQAQLLQKGIRELGEVNLSSLKDYAQVKDRYEFLTQQQNDLLTARRQLQKTMQEMDQEVSQRFEKMFNQVSAAFEVLFPQMFGGGHAQLVLDNPSNLLETGIEIVAQPPGKKLQRLSLLSGGERALTAITLLFAILKVHPVAFCVLDEVEASLDDANVERFANYLNKYDQKTQFIVITHRKGTMMHVNRLYGVTMQESGISSVIT
ncbi:chromosome segregation protein SMC, partial [Lactobacillus sp. XV13L]|nr:chromosome segregation protein SMC [Lactobacillus sp. XV13L]